MTNIYETPFVYKEHILDPVCVWRTYEIPFVCDVHIWDHDVALQKWKQVQRSTTCPEVEHLHISCILNQWDKNHL